LGPEALGDCQLVLAPALAVDRSGTRLGQGGGWYDRALRFAAPEALVIAVCFPWELLPAGVVPRDAHDVPMAGALTWNGAELFG
jgi:5-formyltetrahydrofolate cyclo-ligase